MITPIIEPGTFGDVLHKDLIRKILNEGRFDKSPRPKYRDGTPAHTKSINGVMCQYDLHNGQFPIITLRPIATKFAIGEILWIYQDQSSDLDLLKDKYGITWWDPWDIGNRTIGQCYGATVARHDLINRLLDGIDKDPDGRRHIISLWQDEDFNELHGLKPCCFMTMFNVRHEDDGDYLDMSMTQRSCDYGTAGVINQVQYCVLLSLVARHTGYIPGKFTWFCNNIQLYDRHFDAANELLSREGIDCNPHIWLNPAKTDFYSFTKDDIKIIDYPMDEIKAKNPQLTVFRDEIGI